MRKVWNLPRSPVRDFDTRHDYSEEACVKVKAQRKPALTVKELGAFASIRVVPPSFRSLSGSEARRFVYAVFASQILSGYFRAEVMRI